MTAIVCHRGASLVAPENTFAGADAAIARGAAFVEFDVRRTADGVHVVMHDRDVARTTDGAGFVDALTYGEIARLDAGSWFGARFAGERVPRLEDYLRHLKGRAGAYCEVKRGDCAEIVRIVREAGVDDVFFWGFKPEVRAALRAEAPDMRHMITLEIAGTRAAALAEHGAAILEFSLEDVSPEALADARAHGLSTMIHEPGNNCERLDRLLALAPDYANIDDIDAINRLSAAR
ncbi:MAG: glycerophosphodiester phosphodiesterase family protein [Acuticoccus sp.]